MATKAKLTLSQLLFRRTSNNNNSSSSSSNSNANNANNEACNNKPDMFHNHNDKSSSTGSTSINNDSSKQIHGHSSSSSSNTAANRRMSSSSSGGSISSSGGGGSGGRHNFHEYFQSSDEILKANPPQKLSSSSMEAKQKQQHHPSQRHQTPQQQVNQQLQGILKKPNNGGEFTSGGGLGGRTHRSSLHRSKSNPNPSSNPLKEVSWSCPTLEKRREVILNYFERIILENKQEQQQNAQNKNTTKHNIPCEGGNGEPIYEEISDYSSPPLFNSSPEDNKTGSLKPKLGPKKVRMNIPQDQHLQNGYGQSPIYDKILCRSHSMHESSTSSSSPSSFYDIAPSTATSISSSSGNHHHNSSSFYENFRPSSYYATSVSSSSSESDYGIVGGGGGVNSGKNVTTRIAGRSHSFHDNYRNSGSYNINETAVDTPITSVDTDQLYAKVCKRKKLKAGNNDQQTTQQRPSSYPTAIKSGYYDDNMEETKGELHVQVSCGNVVTMIPVMMPSVAVTTASSSFSTSCLSLSSSSDNNSEDMTTTITTSISSINTRPPNNNPNQNTGHFRYDAEKLLPDKNISYVNSKMEGEGGDSCPASSAAARNRNNLSVIHLLAAYDPTKEIEEFIPAPSFTAIIDSTESAPKSISVPVRVGFSASAANKKNEENSSRKPIMVTNCNFGYDNDAFQDDEEDADADDEDNDSHHHKNLLRSVSTNNTNKDISSSSSGTSSTSGADDDGGSTTNTSDTDTDEDEHHTQKYSFATNGNIRGGVLKNQHRHQSHNRVKRITFQEEDTIITASNGKATTKDLLLLTTSESEDDCEELCEHKSLLEMNHSPTTGGESILDDGKGDKYEMMMDDEDRGFDSFVDDSSENNGVGDNNKGESGDGGSPSYTSENLRNQRTFAQMTQDVPPEQLKKKAASVLDLINSEISDLHMRELELKKLHSPPPPTSGQSENKRKEDEQETLNDGSAEEEFEEGSSGEDDFSDSAIEYDGFTTNGSHSSGQVSPSENLNEMINHHPQQDEEREQVEVSRREEEEDNEEEEGKDVKKDGVDMLRSEVKVRPLDEEEDRSIKFLVSDETPIEREIRLTREREEEFRRKNQPFLAICPPAPSSKISSGSLPVMKTRDISSYPDSQGKPDVAFPVSPTAAAQKDIQLELATARFKKEIEESMNREKELIRETRQKKIEADEEINEGTPPQHKQEDNKTPTAPTSLQVQQPVPPTPPQQSALDTQSQLRKPTLAKLPIAKLPAARFFSPPAFNANKPSRITPVLSPTISKGSLGFPSANNTNNVIGGSLPIGIGRPSFTSFEKYILQASSNYMASKQNGSTPTSANSTTTEDPMKNVTPIQPVAAGATKTLQFNIPEDPLRIIPKPTTKDESSDGDKEEEEEKPKRRYIPAQDKIHQEIQELAMREKELNRSRGKWKSTLDLPEALKDAEEEKETLRRTSSTTQSSLSLNATTTTSTGLVDEHSDDPGANTNTNNEGDFDKLNLLNVTSEDVRQVTRVKAPARRRHSMLISQWEERIRQQQQQNSKK